MFSHAPIELFDELQTVPDQERPGPAEPAFDELRRERLRIAETQALLQTILKPVGRLMRAGETAYRAGDRFSNLYVANAGIFKILNLLPDGREQIVGVKFRGDWMGLDGIASGSYGCDAVAIDTAEVWTIRYQALLDACATSPALLTAFHEAMSRQIVKGRNSLMSVCTLPADARVANFLLDWAQALAVRGVRTDEIALRMTRAEIGNHLGMTLETVSRAMAHMARLKLIGFPDKGRRAIAIPNLERLAAFVQQASPG